MTVTRKIALLGEQVSAEANWEGAFLLLRMRNSYPLHAFWVFRSITDCWGRAWREPGGAYPPNVIEEILRVCRAVFCCLQLRSNIGIFFKASCQNANTNYPQLSNGLHTRKFFCSLWELPAAVFHRGEIVNGVWVPRPGTENLFI